MVCWLWLQAIADDVCKSGTIYATTSVSNLNVYCGNFDNDEKQCENLDIYSNATNTNIYCRDNQAWFLCFVVFIFIFLFFYFEIIGMFQKKKQKQKKNLRNAVICTQKKTNKKMNRHVKIWMYIRGVKTVVLRRICIVKTWLTTHNHAKQHS